MKKGILFEAVVAIAIIFLVFAMYVMVSSGSHASADKWVTNTSVQPHYMLAGDNGILYSFTGNSIFAIADNGTSLWNVTINNTWVISNNWLRLKDTGDIAVGGFTGVEEVSPIATAAGGILYVYLTPNITINSPDITTTNNITEVIAISQDGLILWNVPFESNLTVYGGALLDTASVQAYNGRVYVFHDYEETVIDSSSGHVLFTIPGVSSPAAVDENGNIYTVSTAPASQSSSGNTFGLFVPSNTVSAYTPEGNLSWSHDIGEPVIQQYVSEGVRQQFDTLPIYENGELYLPVQNGTLAMNKDGTIAWVQRFNESMQLLDLMPFDSSGNLYLEYVNQQNLSASSIYVISPDGSNVSAPRPYDEYRSWYYKGASGGVLYYLNVDSPDNRSLAALDTLSLTAYDVRNDTTLWTFPLSTSNVTTITLDTSSINNIFDPYTASEILNGSQQRYSGQSPPTMVFGGSDASVLSAAGRVYISYTDYNYEYPIIPGQSQCTYSIGIVALTQGGNLLWQLPASSPVTAMAVGNGTLFYSTNDGKISAAITDPVTGLTIAVLVYAFLRIFMFGAVSRARSRLDKNQNRNGVFKFIAEHPGSTLYEISRGLKMNLGTARYHVLILGINHRITSQKADNKYVRFFTNSNSYSQEDQVLLSFIRREPTRKVLGLILEKPGLTNVDLSRELGIAESTISKYIKELSSKEIIAKEPLPGGRSAYSIRKEYKERVALALESLKCDL